MGFIERSLNKAVKRSIKGALKPKPRKRATGKSTTSLSNQRPYNLKPWDILAPEHEIVFPLEFERKVYVYDSGPVSRLRMGEQIILEAFRGDGSMKSVHTGTMRTNGEFDDTIMLYNGVPIGFAEIPREKVKAAAKMGYALKFHGACCGFVPGYNGVKNIVISCPRRIYLYDCIPGAKDDRPLSMRDDAIVYNEYDEEDYINLVTRDKWTFRGAKMEIVPPPPKSQAKPHVRLVSSRGVKISEVAAKNHYYGQMVHLAETFRKFDVKATRRITDDGRAYYHIEVVASDGGSPAADSSNA